MRRLLPGLALAMSLAACAPAKHPIDGGAEIRARLARSFEAAFEVEQTRGPDAAVDAYLSLLDDAVDKGDPGAAAVLAATEELFLRRPLGGLSVPSAEPLALRSLRWDSMPARLEGLLARARDPLSRHVLAVAALGVAEQRGDEAGAAKVRAQAGVFPALTVVGPLVPIGVVALAASTPLDAAVLPHEVEGAKPFSSALLPRVVTAEDGVVDPARTGARAGVYAAAGDVLLDRDAEGFVLVHSAVPFVLASGGKALASRAPEDGWGWMVRVARVHVPKGRSRLVLRVPQGDEPSKVSLALALEGAAPTLSAPAPGDRADVAIAATPWQPAAEGALAGAARLALGDDAGALATLEGRGELASLLLATGPTSMSPDVPSERRAERLRALYAKAKAVSPASWEAEAGDVVLSASRKGVGEARFDVVRGLSREGIAPTTIALRAAVAAGAGLRDVAAASLAEARPALSGTPFWKLTEDRSLDLDAPAREARACLDPLGDRRGLDCLGAKRQRGDLDGALTEIQRLRALRGSPTLLRDEELRLRVSKGALDEALALYEQMLPGERTVTLLGAFPARRDLVARDRATAREGASMEPLLHLLSGFDVTKAQRRGREVVLATPPRAGDATSVLLHEERWELARDGILVYSILDVRRVGGTSDVERGGSQALFAGVWGRDTRKLLYRRIHKKDGRLLEPDRARNAEQSDADLSQLEPGDVIEQAAYGLALPDRLGHIVVDTPDLLPERTSVRSATIEIVLPADVAVSLAASKQLGTPERRDADGKRTLVYRLMDAAPRTFEDGVPRMDRDVSVSFGTYRWSDIARAVADLVATSEDRDPIVRAWALAAAGEGSPREKVARLLTAVGKAVKVANSSMLSDLAAATGAAGLRARPILDLGQGSRTWLLHRALETVGIPHELALAEREPFSENPDFPARPGRYDRPLLLVHTPEGALFVDADVQGPPLPLGDISPELLGRTALLPSGETVELPRTIASRGDEIALDLTVDERGDAVGTISLELRGRSSQALLDALDTVVGTDRRALLRRVVLGWLPWATVDEVRLTSPEGATFVSIAAKVVLPSYLQREGAVWVLPGVDPVHYGYPAPGTATMRGAFTTKGARDTALVVSTSQRWALRRKVTLPAGFAVVRAPEPKIASAPLVEAKRSTAVAGVTVEDAFSLDVTTGAVPAAGYAAFARLAKDVDDAFLAGVRITGR